MNTKEYIISQRLSYLALGSIIGFFIGLNEAPINFYMIMGFVLLTVLMGWWIKRK